MSEQVGKSASEPAPAIGTACPTVEQLQAFTGGLLSLADLKAISTHLMRCSRCETKLSTIVERAEELPYCPPDGPLHELRGEASPCIFDSDNSPLGHAMVESSRPAGGGESGESKILEPTMPLQLGQYRLLRQIGRGGMGVVYRAWHERLHREVALKLLPSEQFNDPVGVERLQREMVAAGNLRHPNIVYATDAGEAGGIHYLRWISWPGLTCRGSSRGWARFPSRMPVNWSGKRHWAWSTSTSKGWCIAI
jgi:hypothetical protein